MAGKKIPASGAGWYLLIYKVNGLDFSLFEEIDQGIAGSIQILAVLLCADTRQHFIPQRFTQLNSPLIE